jgi:cyclic lactone autoinducer peptide
MFLCENYLISSEKGLIKELKSRKFLYFLLKGLFLTITYPIFYNTRHKKNLYGKMARRKEVAMKTSIAINIKKVVAKIAKKSASIEANTACSIWHYQSKEPAELRKLRKF